MASQTILKIIFLRNQEKLKNLMKEKEELYKEIKNIDKKVSDTQKEYLKEKYNGKKVLRVKVEIYDDAGYIYIERLLYKDKKFKIHYNKESQKKAAEFFVGIKFDVVFIESVFGRSIEHRTPTRIKVYNRGTFLKYLLEDKTQNFMTVSPVYKNKINFIQDNLDQY